MSESVSEYSGKVNGKRFWIRFAEPEDDYPSALGKIIARAAQRHGVTVEDVMGRRRFAGIARARHEAMAAVRAELGWSFPQIGRVFGRDASSVMHAINKLAGNGRARHGL